MQVFKLFFQILRSHLVSSLIYVFVFLVIAFAAASSGNSTEQAFKETKLKVCIFDKDQTVLSKSLVDTIAKKQQLVSLKEEKKKITDALYYEKVDDVIVINKGYAEKIEKGGEGLFGEYHMHDSYSVVMMQQFLDEYVRSVRAYIAGGTAPSEAVKKTEKIMAKEAEVTYLEQDTASGTGDFPESFSTYFRFMPYILFSAIINALCPILLVMNAQDIRYRTNSSGMSPARYMLYTFFASAVAVLAIWLLLMAGGMSIYGGIYQGIAWLAVLNSFIFTLISTMIALLVAAFRPNGSAVNIIAQVIGLGMSFLCGIFVTQDLLGSGVLAFAKCLPAYWYVKANNMLAGIETYQADQVRICLLVEVGFVVLLGILTFLKYSGGRRMRTAIRRKE